MRGEPRINFSDLLAAIKFRAGLLTAMGDQEGASAKVAAVLSSSPSSENKPEVTPEEPRMMTYADRVASSPPMQQSTERCGVCESIHATENCATLARMDPDEKVKKLQEKKLCFHCLQAGHEARSCTVKVRCVVCHKAHNSILHGRTFPTPAPRLSAKAPTYQPTLQPINPPLSQPIPSSTSSSESATL